MSNYNRSLHRTREKNVTEGGKGVSVNPTEVRDANKYSRIVDWGDKHHTVGKHIDEVNSMSKGVSKMDDTMWKTKRSRDHQKSLQTQEPKYIAHVNLKKTDKNTQDMVKKGAVASNDKITVVKNPMHKEAIPEQLRSKASITTKNGNTRRKRKGN